MAVLEKMRKRMGVFISIIIALALLAFIVDPNDLQRVMSMFSSKYDVGKIAGKTINQQEFQKRVEKYTRIIGDGNDLDREESSDRATNLAWQSFIADYVLIPACEKAGINVGDAEMLDMAKPGIYTSPVYYNEPAFLNENGMLDPEKMQQFIQVMNSDQSGQLSEYWSYLQNNAIQDRMFTKYTTMLAKSASVNKLQARKDIAENNNSFDVDFILQPAPFAKDSTVTVSNEEIKQYYENIKPSLKKVETRDAAVVILPINPSEKDVNVAKEDMEKLYAEFQTVADADIKNFIDKNSDTPLSEIYFKEGDLKEISSIVDEFASKNGKGSFLEPQPYDNFFVGAKILDVAQRPDSVYLRYIPVADEKTADSLMSVIKTEADFVTSAASMAPQQGNQEPGLIGWATESFVFSQLPLDFMKAFSAKKGDMFKMEYNGFYVVGRVDNLTKPVRKAKVALLTRLASASQETFTKVYEKARELRENSNGSIDKFEKYALDNNMELLPVEDLVGGAKTISSYDKMKEVSRWIFEEKEGAISDVFTIDNKYYAVAAVKKIHPAGYAQLSELAPQIREYLTMKKKVAKLAEETAGKVGDASTIEEAADKLILPVSNLTDVTFSSLSSNNQTDPVLVGAIAKAGADNNHKLVGPVKGVLGVAYFQIKDHKNSAFYTESDAQRKSEQNIYSILNVLPQVMCDDAGIDDKRYKFY